MKGNNTRKFGRCCNREEKERWLGGDIYIYIFGRRERVCTPPEYVVTERERASMLGKKKESLNSREKEKELQCTREK